MRALNSKLPALKTNWDPIPRATTDGRSHIAGVPDELAIEIDANGSPVTVHEADWFVCFVPGLQRQWWHRFTNEKHKHVFLMRIVDDETWILVEPWWTRMMVNVLSLDEAVKFLRWGAVGNILEVRERIPGRGSQARGWSNCAVLVSYLLGRSYWTWTPHGLYKRLLAEEGVRPVDLSQFLVQHFEHVANKNADEALKPILAHREGPLEDVLQDIGSGLVTAMMSRSALGLYKVAVSESSHFKDAADVYWTLGPKRVIEHVRGVLEEARHRGEVCAADYALAARQFVAMLRGDLHLQIIFGMRMPPTPAEIQAHVKSAVAVFLYGTMERDRLPETFG